MISKNQIKNITRLQQKKYRQQEGLFIAEGVKVINEFLNSTFKLVDLFTTKTFNVENETLITEAELKKISALKTPNTALAVFKIPKLSLIESKGLIVALDALRDPGNLGTIIRLCDWFGVKQLLCSKETVDCFNPKVVQATMGSLTRVNVFYIDLNHYLEETKQTVFGAFMDGENVYASNLPTEGILVLGNEANGISQSIEKHVNQRISIPRFGDLQATESLNVATAGAILLSEFRRSN
ncbi:TrmH family RNA methyltransferase [Mesoflavibacter sabulilitoris]|uniref:RNA methyltransferase n=1 Tax=Mesoflavibacter zeaxanthinifaciens subsp. sabulilitoris TaxID=1520893 RepID=A0A2T1N7Q4_9FLAO|nr:RNA methyltransferase [Mesoflavibacter zeaxanthinifaciens]MBB3123924.1 TrmH family RNA methyltransferase [Mesoflavibacter zeaxanthinifaciens subsp. sabulilitoris]PSG87898.1 RNA methyltransferase [Mesoflavibacter zeaxanthinifaciens subsp. sabulilitoris]